MAFPYVPNPTWANDEAGGTEIDAAALNLLEAGIVKAGVRGTGTSAPSSPTDGDLWRYPADAANGVYWLMQYVESVTDWVFLGGPPLTGEVLTEETVTNTAYTDWATAGPSVTVPKAGDYLVRWEASCRKGTSTAVAYIAVKRGSATAADNDGFAVGLGSGANDEIGSSAERRFDGLAASDVLKMQAKASSGSVVAERRRISVVPFRFT